MNRAATAVVVVAVLAALSVAVVVGGLRIIGGDGSATPTTVATTVVRLVPGPGQTFLTGQAERVVVENAQSRPIPAPFTLTAVERGVGKATIENALVDGQRTTISWAGGQPLPINGRGGLDLAAARVEVTAAGVTWSLDGAGRALLPGDYRAGAPVAVGTSGIAGARDNVRFTADSRTVVVTAGNVVVRQRLEALELDGPGSVTAEGRLQLVSPSASQDTGYVRMADSPFHLRATPGGPSVTVDAVLQGPVTTDR